MVIFVLSVCVHNSTTRTHILSSTSTIHVCMSCIFWIMYAYRIELWNLNDSQKDICSLWLEDCGIFSGPRETNKQTNIEHSVNVPPKVMAMQ